MILDKEGGVETARAIVDYKTSTSADADHALQIQVHTDAGRREGLDMRGAYVHDLKAGSRSEVDISDDAIQTAEETIKVAADRIRVPEVSSSASLASDAIEQILASSLRAGWSHHRFAALGRSMSPPLPTLDVDESGPGWGHLGPVGPESTPRSEETHGYHRTRSAESVHAAR